METIKLETVNSTNIHSVGHNAEMKILIVKFNNGSTYQYQPVTEQGYRDLKNAESIGSFFFKNIKNNETLSTIKLS